MVPSAASLQSQFTAKTSVAGTFTIGNRQRFLLHDISFPPADPCMHEALRLLK
jgi:hypothetical protein